MDRAYDVLVENIIYALSVIRMKYNGHKYVITDVPGIVKQRQSEGCSNSKMLNARIIDIVNRCSDIRVSIRIMRMRLMERDKRKT